MAALEPAAREGAASRPPSPPAPRSRRRRAWRALAWALVFLTSVLLGLLLHGNLPAVRWAVRDSVQRALEGKFRGRVDLGEVERLGLTSTSLARLEVRDEAGRSVLALEGVQLRYRAWQWLSLLLTDSEATLRVDHVRVERARLELRQDTASGQWTLARALESPRPPAAERKTPKRARLGYRLDNIELGELDLKIEHPSVGPVEAHVHHARARASLAGEDSDVSVERFGVRLRGAGGLTLDGTGSLRLLPNGYVAGAFHGFVAGIEMDAAAQLDGRELGVRIDVPRALPEQVRRLWPGWPLQRSLAAHVTARGPAQALSVEARVEADGSQMAARGQLSLEGPPRARLEVQLERLDARLFSPDAPATDIAAQAEVRVARGERGATVNADGQTQPTRIAGVPLPASRFSLQLSDAGLHGSVDLADARGQLHGEARFPPSLPAQLQLRASQVDLQAWPELAGRVRGRADFAARAQLAPGRIEGELEGKLSHVAAGELRFAEGRLELSFAGDPFAARQLQLDTHLRASGLQIGGMRFERGEWTSSGQASRAAFDLALLHSGGGRGQVRGRFELEPSLRLSGLNARWSERDLELQARASQCWPDQRRLHLEQLLVSGAAGTLRGSAQLGPRHVEVSLDTDGLDTQRLAQTFGATHLGLSGKLTGHAELSTAPLAPRGNIDVRMRDLSLRNVALGTLELHATLHDRRVVAALSSAGSPFGRLDARTTAILDGSVLEPGAWQRATGEGSVRLQHLPLWPIALVLPKRAAVRDLGGHLDLALQLERGASRELPSLFLQADTRELTFTLASNPGAGGQPTAYDQFALHASASVDGQSGRGSATLLLTDPDGALVTTSGSLALDLRRLLERPSEVLEQLLRSPLDALMRLHARPLSALPRPLRVPDLEGTVEATLQLSGSLLDPRLDLALQGRELLGSFANSQSAIDVSGLLHFVPKSGELTGRADAAHAGKSLVSARLEGRLQPRGGRAAAPSLLSAWDVNELRAAAMLNGVPLELWPAAARQHLAARLYGSVALERHGSELRQQAYIQIGDLAIDGQALGNGRFTLHTVADRARAELRIGSGEQQLRAQLQSVPGEEGRSAGLTGSVTARNFAVVSLSPLVDGILSRLGGSVNADAVFELQRAAHSGWQLGINGQAQLQRGSAHLDLFGLELNELNARIQARSTPEHTVLSIGPLEARSRSRRANVHGEAELWLQGLRVVSGEAKLSLDDVPLTLESTARGTARGRLAARLERKPDFMDLKVDVPELRVLLPASSARSLIALDPNPDIHLRQVSERASTPDSDALLWRMAFEIGDAVRLERADLNLPLSGTPRLEYQQEVRPSGTIEARPGGRITLFDQNFQIDHGVLQFDAEAPANPRLDVTASWRAPDGTTIYVDITGRAKEAGVLTRDDRGLQDVDRFYLLTGNPGAVASMGSAGLGEAPAADGAALGQTVALGINQLLRESVGNVAVSIETTPDDRASYGARVRLSERLWLQGSYRPAAPETEQEEGSSDVTGTLEYQFSRNWSLRTELGTTGGAFDLLWSHRY